jgi:hypothetical protein
MADVWTAILAEIAAALGGTGFRKKGHSFSDRTTRGVLKSIQLEKFRWNTAFERKFALKLRIDLADRDDADPSARDWSEHSTPVLVKNAGYLWNDENFLFRVPDSWPCASFSSTLRRHIREDVLPFFQRCSSFDAVVGDLKQENARLGANVFSTTLAIALARRGRLEESREFFLESPGDPAAIRAVASRYGIDLAT